MPFLKIQHFHGGGLPGPTYCWPLTSLKLGVVLQCRNIFLLLRYGYWTYCLLWALDALSLGHINPLLNLPQSRSETSLVVSFFGFSLFTYTGILPNLELIRYGSHVKGSPFCLLLCFQRFLRGREVEKLLCLYRCGFDKIYCHHVCSWRALYSSGC